MKSEPQFEGKVIEDSHGVEYSKSKTERGHIEEVQLRYKDGLPVEMLVGDKSYEVVASAERTSTKKFFEHTKDFDVTGSVAKQRHNKNDMIIFSEDQKAQVDFENQVYEGFAQEQIRPVKAITFSNKHAATLFEEVVSAHRSHVVGSIRQAIETELQLEHGDVPGGYRSRLTKLMDKLEATSTVAAAKTGKPKEGKVKTLVELSKDTAEDLVDNYFPLKTPQTQQTDPCTVLLIEDDPLSFVTQEVIEWLDQLQEADIPVRIHGLEAKMGKWPARMFRVSLGKLGDEKSDNFDIEQDALSVIYFAADKFGYRRSRTLGIIEYLHLDEWFDRNSTEYSGVRKFLGASAIHSRRTNLISLAPGAKQFVDRKDYGATENVVNVDTTEAAFLARLVTHETGHFVNTHSRTSTRAQVEGFATSMEMGFSFELVCKRLLEEDRSYEPTYELLDFIFSTSAENLSRDFKYGIPATFYSWIYEQLGPAAVKRFHGLITGGSISTSKRGVPQIIADIQNKKDLTHFRGNLINCLDNMPRNHRWRWESSEEMVKNYLEDLKSELKAQTTT